MSVSSVKEESVVAIANLAFGLDTGNAMTKLIGPVPHNRLLIPHALAPVGSERRDVALLPDATDPVGYLHAVVESPALPDPQEVFAGELAVREYPDLIQEAREGERKSVSERHLTLALLTIAAGMERLQYWNEARVHLAVGLPLVEARDPEARRTLSQRLVGRHVVRWVSTPRWAGTTRQVQIASVDVIPEGGAAYLALASRNPSLLDLTTLVVDVGARSLDWVVFGPGGKFQQGLSGGAADGGVAIAADRILAAAREQLGPHVARHRLDVLQALEELPRTGHVVIWARGRKYDVTKLAEPELERLAREITRLMMEAADRTGRMDRLALVGGGGALLAPYLKRVCDLPISLTEDPAWANADGLHQRAVRLSATRGER